MKVRLVMRNRLFLAGRILKSALFESIRPYKLTFAVTARCNSRCRSCATWRHDAVDELSLEEIEHFFSVNPHFQWLDLTGGEFFLRDDAVDIARIALHHSRRCFHLHIPTNAVDPHRTASGVTKINALAADLFTVTISLDGPPEVHDRIRGVAGNWQAAMEVYQALKGLTSASFRIFFGFTASPWNLGDFPATVAAVRQRFPEVTLHHFHLNLYHRSSHYYRTRGESPPFQGHEAAVLDQVHLFRRGIGGSFDPIAHLERRYLGLVNHFLATGRSPLPCQALAESLFLSADGTVYPCSIWDRPLGNLRRDGFHLEPILAASSGVRKEVRDERCPGCWTPCEAYPSILAGFWRSPRSRPSPAAGGPRHPIPSSPAASVTDP
ncbi:MAG: radical SAM protein [Magnetococcales bacterium]|nr:radical SAM protein [Magnetococcales bacterium]